MRLIDADSMIQSIENNEYYTDKLKRVMNCIVDSRPTVDAVPVVRCCECKKCATDECCFFARGEWGMSGPDWNFYCADGERKGGDE